ncbi:MAG: hypothetical protein GX130_05270 [Candidatus Hydrogenedens sp.]|jgi:hypothetical protein|nr:hypothetical protein [Candidatus Hydrogenedens sp.]
MKFFTVKTDIDDEQRSRIEAGENPAKVLYAQDWFIWLPLPQGGHTAQPLVTYLTDEAVNAIFELPEDEPGEWFINIGDGLNPAIAFTASGAIFGEDEPNPNECIQLDESQWLILSCIPVS